jgi:hypothetical protein
MSQIDGPYHTLATAQSVKTEDAVPDDDTVTKAEVAIPSPVEPLDDLADASYFEEKAEDREPRFKQEPDEDLGDDDSSYDGGSERTLLGDADVEEGSRPILIDKTRDNRLGSFGTLLFEQRARWIPYTLVGLTAIGAGCKCLIPSIPLNSEHVMGGVEFN